MNQQTVKVGNSLITLQGDKEDLIFDSDYQVIWYDDEGNQIVGKDAREHLANKQFDKIGSNSEFFFRFITVNGNKHEKQYTGNNGIIIYLVNRAFEYFRDILDNDEISQSEEKYEMIKTMLELNIKLNYLVEILPETDSKIEKLISWEDARQMNESRLKPTN